MRGFLFSKTGLVLIGFLGVAGYFLWTEHQAHVITFLPFLLLGGCILMHVFMHGGHGHGGHDGHNGGDGPKHRGHGDDKDGAGNDR